MKKIKKRIRFQVVNILFYCGFYCILFLFSCETPTEGCLDVFAENYDVTADKDCCTAVSSCCCTYPELSLSIQHKLSSDNTTDFSLDSVYTVEVDSSHYFKVNDICFYLSAIQLQSTSGRRYGVRDSVRIATLDAQGISVEKTIENNVTLIKPNTSNYTIGSVRDTFVADSIVFLVGLNTDFNQVNLERLPSDHILNTTESDSLYINSAEGFIFNQINISRTITSLTDSTYLKINEITPVSLALPSPILVTAGFDVTINLRINYLEWFKGINFVVTPTEEISLIVHENTSRVFEIVE